MNTTPEQAIKAIQFLFPETERFFIITRFALPAHKSTFVFKRFAMEVTHMVKLFITDKPYVVIESSIEEAYARLRAMAPNVELLANIRYKKWLALKELECSICMSNEKTVNAELPCKHMFHENCLRDWVEMSETASCPLCRGEASVGKYIMDGMSITFRDKWSVRANHYPILLNVDGEWMVNPDHAQLVVGTLRVYGPDPVLNFYTNPWDLADLYMDTMPLIYNGLTGIPEMLRGILRNN